MNIDVNHNVYSNNCSLLYFDRFLTENILYINLKVHFLGWPFGIYGMLGTNPRKMHSISVTFINRLKAEMILHNLKNMTFIIKNNYI